MSRSTIVTRHEAAHRRHQLLPHLNRASGQTWEDIYPHWQSSDLKYYWKDLHLTVIPSDYARQDRAFVEALELARQGNELARPLLDRIVRRDPTSTQASAAREALTALDARTTAAPAT